MHSYGICNVEEIKTWIYPPTSKYKEQSNISLVIAWCILCGTIIDLLPHKNLLEVVGPIYYTLDVHACSLRDKDRSMTLIILGFEIYFILLIGDGFGDIF